MRGRDIKRYSYNWCNLYVVLAYYGSHKILEVEHPAIYRHLFSYKKQLEVRGQCRYTSSGKPNKNPTAGYPGQHHWLELDNNPTLEKLEDFSKPKVMWAETMRIRRENTERFPRFSYTTKPFFSDKTCFIAVGEDLKYILAFLNSTFGRYQFSQTVSMMDNGGYLMQKIYVEQIRVSKLTKAKQIKLISLVDCLLDTTREQLHEAIEDQIDTMVFEAFEIDETEQRYLKEILSRPLDGR